MMTTKASTETTATTFATTLRAERRERQASYHARKSAVAEALLRGDYLEYCPGMMGGTLGLPGGEHVSAQGALKEAGADPCILEEWGGKYPEVWQRRRVSIAPFQDEGADDELVEWWEARLGA
jgi:hypothetical protein